MSNLPQNPYNNVPGAPAINANPGLPSFNHNPNPSQVPASQLPPGYGQLKQDPNSNSPVHGPPNKTIGYIQNTSYNQSGSNSPAFNAPGILPPTASTTQGSPLKPLSKPATPVLNQSPNISTNSSPRPGYNANSLSNPYPQPYPQQKHINDNAPPLIPSSQFNQALSKGPPVTAAVSQHQVKSQPPFSNPYNAMVAGRPSASVASLPPAAPPLGSQIPNFTSLSAPSNGPPRNSPLIPGPLPTGAPMSGPPASGVLGPPNGPSPNTLSGPPKFPPMPTNGQNGPLNHNGPPMSTQKAGPPRSMPSGSGPITMPPQNGPAGPMTAPMPVQPLRPGNVYPPPPHAPAHLQNYPPHPHPGPPPVEPMKSNMQNRYPPTQQSNVMQQLPPPLQQGQGQYPQQYNAQGITQQMGQLSVTKQGFDQLWGHQMLDLMTARHIVPEYPEDPPEIKLGHPFVDAPNCSPEIFRCTINRIPENNSLLQKSRLPLGILVHPFKDLNHLPVIQCTTIVRCRACRTYINPFVYFVDAKRWKCNLCYRVNDLPEEFQYDPVSKSYGDPTRRPEIKSATIEFIAPGEYMLRPPQPAVYLFLFDVSQIARDSGYLQIVCDTLKENLDQLPGDARTQVGFICYDSHVHYYLMSDDLTRPKEMTILDIDEVFLPSPSSLLVNLRERRELVRELLSVLPQRTSAPGVPSSALGAALQAGYKLMAPTGGRITVFQTCLPNIGPGALQPREDPNARSSKEVAHLNPATDFYKRIALDCSGAQIAVDLFLLNSQYSDLATLSGISKFSGGTLYHIPLFLAKRHYQRLQLEKTLTRYLTRKIGFEAVMRVRCTRGITIHTFHGNFFVRSTDLLSLPNVSPDAGFGMQLTIEESLADLQQVCFQAALLYTSSKGERRIRVHTLALPLASNLTEVLYAADQQCIIGLLAKMAVDRCMSASMSEAREALINVAIDALSAYRLSQNLPAGSVSATLHAPVTLRLLPLYLLALTKTKAFRTGTSTRLDDRIADMCQMKSLPLYELMRSVYPDLYPIHDLSSYMSQNEDVPDPPRLQLTAERINSNGAYLLDDGSTMIIYVCHNVSPAFLSETFRVTSFLQLPDEMRALPEPTEENSLFHAFIEKLNDDRPFASDVLILRDNSPLKQLFTERLVDDRVESAFSYYEFLQHVKSQVK